jgi:hypothetical protein
MLIYRGQLGWIQNTFLWITRPDAESFVMPVDFATPFHQIYMQCIQVGFAIAIDSKVTVVICLMRIPYNFTGSDMGCGMSSNSWHMSKQISMCEAY